MLVSIERATRAVSSLVFVDVLDVEEDDDEPHAPSRATQASAAAAEPRRRQGSAPEARGNGICSDDMPRRVEMPADGADVGWTHSHPPTDAARVASGSPRTPLYFVK